MKIQGNYKEFRFLINMAIRLKGEFMYLTPEGDMWLLYDGGKTFYLKTNLEVSHHIIFSWETIQNIERACKRMKVETPLTDDDNFFALEPELLQIGRYGDRQLKVRIDMERARMYSQFVRKFEELEFLIEPTGTPQIILESSLLKKYNRDVRAHYRGYDRHKELSVALRAQSDENKNVIQFGEDENLWFFRMADSKALVPRQAFTYSSGFFLKEEYWNYPFYLSDSDIALMLLLDKYEHIEEFRLLLYKDYYVMDTYGSDVHFKVWRERKKTAKKQIMLQE